MYFSRKSQSLFKYKNRKDIANYKIAMDKELETHEAFILAKNFNRNHQILSVDDLGQTLKLLENLEAIGHEKLNILTKLKTDFNWSRAADEWLTFEINKIKMK